MPLYTFQCDRCRGVEAIAMTFAEHDLWRLREFHPHTLRGDFIKRNGNHTNRYDCGGELKQVFGVNFTRGIQEHFNPSLGKVVSSNAQVKSELSRQSAEMSERMGFEHNYELVDPSDPGAVGATEHGLEDTERALTDSGQRETKLYL